MHIAVSGEGDLHTDIAGPRGPTGPNGPKKHRGRIRKENIKRMLCFGEKPTKQYNGYSSDANR